MILEVSSIQDPGNLERERLILKAIDKGDLGHYVVFRAEKNEDSVSGGSIPDAYWFEDREIKKGDLVVLYSKAGKRSEKANASGTTSYFFYWGKGESLWTDDYRAVLLNASEWGFGN